jgi:hypothetical protein
MNNIQKALYTQMVAKASSLPVEELKRVMLEDLVNPTLPVGVFESLLDALEGKVSEDEFKAFCDDVNELY